MAISTQDYDITYSYIATILFSIFKLLFLLLMYYYAHLNHFCMLILAYNFLHYYI